jgi:hypothetical protein
MSGTAFRRAGAVSLFALTALFPALAEDAKGQFFRELEIRTDSQARGFGDISRTALTVRPLRDTAPPLFRVTPLEPSDPFQIVVRVGTRAQTSGDSKTLVYASETYDLAGGSSAAEHQALYGINVYRNGTFSGDVAGTYGMCQSVPGEGHTLAVCTGIRGIAFHGGAGGQSTSLFGGSFTAQTSAGTDTGGHVGSLVGVRGHAQSRSAATVSQAVSVYGVAPDVTGTGAVGVAIAGRFDQPHTKASGNYALALAEGSPAGGDIRLGFRRADGTFPMSIVWNDNPGRIEFDSNGVVGDGHDVTISGAGPVADGYGVRIHDRCADPAKGSLTLCAKPDGLYRDDGVTESYIPTAVCGTVVIDAPPIAPHTTGMATARVAELRAGDRCVCSAPEDIDDDLVPKDCFGTDGELHLRLRSLDPSAPVDPPARRLDYCCFR